MKVRLDLRVMEINLLGKIIGKRADGPEYGVFELFVFANYDVSVLYMLFFCV
jgi:hypothetical protein